MRSKKTISVKNWSPVSRLYIVKKLLLRSRRKTTISVKRIAIFIKSRYIIIYASFYTIEVAEVILKT